MLPVKHCSFAKRTKTLICRDYISTQKQIYLTWNCKGTQTSISNHIPLQQERKVGNDRGVEMLITRHDLQKCVCYLKVLVHWCKQIDQGNNLCMGDFHSSFIQYIFFCNVISYSIHFHRCTNSFPISFLLGTTFISCGKDVIKIIHYGADFYPVEVNLVALPFGMYTACFYITLPAYVGCLYKRCQGYGGM